MTAPQTIDTDALRKLCAKLLLGLDGHGGDHCDYACDAQEVALAYLRILDELDRLRAAEAASKVRVEDLEARCGLSVGVGIGLSVYGSAKAIVRVQDYMMLDSSHPVEKDDCRRSLACALQTAEAEITRIYAASAVVTDEMVEAAAVPIYEIIRAQHDEPTPKWVPRGNSDKQYDARKVARRALTAARAGLARLTDAGAGKCVAKTNEPFPADCKMGMPERCPICEPVPPPPAAADRGVRGQDEEWLNEVEAAVEKTGRIAGATATFNVKRLIALARAALATAPKAEDVRREALDAVLHWATRRCPCENEQPNPCPLCGADVNKPGACCLSAENTIPPRLLQQIRLALAEPAR